jgi:DNA-binding response OmpR family regulator
LRGGQISRFVVIEREGERPRVLLVEDDAAVTRILSLLLKNSGFDVTGVGSGKEALFALDARPYDAVVLDLGLPDGLGGKVLAKLQGTPRDCYPAWLVISALDEDEVLRRYGPVKGPFLAKPFDPLYLVDLLDKQIERCRAAHR